MTRIKGLEILYSTVKEDLKSKEDCVVAAIHCILLNSDLLCVGAGEVFSANDADTATEHLPENWNINQDIYCLRYRSKDLKNCYLLKISKAGCNLHVDFGLNDNNLATTTVNTNEFVSDDFVNFSQAFMKLNELKNQILEDILTIVVEFENKTICPSKNETSRRKVSSKNEPNQKRPNAENSQYQPISISVNDLRQTGSAPLALPQIGASDLDPFGRSQGSMLYDPSGGSSSSPLGGSGLSGLGPHGGSGNTGFPAGTVPPGARFDPISPTTPFIFKPDPDVFIPDNNALPAPGLPSPITPFRFNSNPAPLRPSSNNNSVPPDARFNRRSPDTYFRFNSDTGTYRSPDAVSTTSPFRFLSDQNQLRPSDNGVSPDVRFEPLSATSALRFLSDPNQVRPPDNHDASPAANFDPLFPHAP